MLWQQPHGSVLCRHANTELCTYATSSTFVMLCSQWKHIAPKPCKLKSSPLVTIPHLPPHMQWHPQQYHPVALQNLQGVCNRLEPERVLAHMGRHRLPVMFHSP